MESKLTAFAIAVGAAVLAFAGSMIYMQMQLKDLRAEALRRDQQTLEVRAAAARSEEAVRLLREELGGLSVRVVNTEKAGGGKGFGELEARVEAALRKLDGKLAGPSPSPGSGAGGSGATSVAMPFDATVPGPATVAEPVEEPPEADAAPVGPEVRFAVLPVGRTDADAEMAPPTFQAGLVKIIQGPPWGKRRLNSAVSVDVADPPRHWSKGLKDGKLQKTILAAADPAHLPVAQAMAQSLPHVFGVQGKAHIFCVKDAENEAKECKNLAFAMSKDFAATDAQLLVYVGNKMLRFNEGNLRGYKDALADLDSPKKKRKR